VNVSEGEVKREMPGAHLHIITTVRMDSMISKQVMFSASDSFRGVKVSFDRSV